MEILNQRHGGALISFNL